MSARSSLPPSLPFYQVTSSLPALTDAEALDCAVLGLFVAGVAGALSAHHGPVAVAVAVRAQAVLVVQAG